MPPVILECGRLLTLTHKDFNGFLALAIDDTIRELLGRTVLDGLHSKLETKYSVSRDELPYRTETMYQLLETSYQILGAKTIGALIARRLYAKLGIPYHTHDGYTLNDYVEDAKTKLKQ